MQRISKEWTLRRGIPDPAKSNDDTAAGREIPAEEGCVFRQLVRLTATGEVAESLGCGTGVFLGRCRCSMDVDAYATTVVSTHWEKLIQECSGRWYSDEYSRSTIAAGSIRVTTMITPRGIVTPNSRHIQKIFLHLHLRPHALQRSCNTQSIPLVSK